MKIIITILTICVFALQTIAQTDCENNVSTNPNAPTNNNLPYLFNSSNQLELTGNKYLNGFDWINQNGSISYQYDLVNMSFNGAPYVMNNIMSYSIPQYEYISQNVAPLVKNGWELLLVNLGYFPNNTDTIPVGADNNSAFPYIVLYNKYSGIVRVFTNFGEDSDAGQGGNAIEITLKFLNPDEIGASGLLRLYEGQDQALDQQTDVEIMSSIVVKPAQGSHWASTDFQVTYDPCTCFYISKLALSIKSISVSDVVLNGMSISQTVDLVDANGNLSSNVNNFINGFERNLSQDKSGMLIYKNIQYSIDEYIKKQENYKTQLTNVGEHNDKVEYNLKVLKAAKIVFAGMLNPSLLEGAGTSVIAATQSDLVIWNTIDSLNAGYTSISGNGDKLFDTDKVIKAAKKILGESGNTFIANNLELQDKPSAPTMPSVTLTEMKYTGQITTATEAGGVAFYSPGVYGSSHVDSIYLENFYEYPVYNEVLGVFALLESPKVKVSHVITEKTNDFDYKERLNPQNLYYQVLTKRYQKWEHNYQIQLDEDLKFAFNDVLDIKSYEIKAAYSINANIDTLDRLLNIEGTLINARQGSENVNVYAINSVNEVGYPIVTDANNYGFYEVTTTDTNWFSYNNNNYATIMDTAIKYYTPYVTINAFQPYTAGVSLMNESIKFKDYYDLEYDNATHTNPPLPFNYGFDYNLDIELKLMVDVVFNTLNSEGVNNTTTLLLTYKINPNDITPSNTSLVSNLPGSLSDISQYQANSYFGDTHFNGQQIDGCDLDYNQYTCVAYEDITIDGDITVGYGFHVDFNAGNEIYVINESNISPEAVLQIEHVYNYSQPMPQVTQQFVSDFCLNSNSYTANKPRNLRKDTLGNLIEAENSSKINNVTYQNIDFNLFPNPTTNSTTIVVNDIRNENLTIKLMDVSGKQINVNIEQQNGNSYILDVNHLEAGIYFVTVSTFGGSKTKRLVVQ